MLRLIAGVSLTGALVGSSVLAQERESVGITLAARGDVEATDLVNLEARELQRRSELFNVDRVVTAADARAQLRMQDDALVSLRPDSELVIAEYEFDPETGEGKAVMELVSGGLRTLSGGISPSSGNAEYELRTTAGSIGIRGTHYEVVDTDSGVFMGVWEGDIDVQPAGGGQGFSIGRNSDYSYAAVQGDGDVEFFMTPPEVFSEGGSDIPEPEESEEEGTGDDSEDGPGQGEGNASENANENAGGSEDAPGNSGDAGPDLAIDDLPEPAQDAPGMDVVQRLMDGGGPPGLSGNQGAGGAGVNPGQGSDNFKGNYQTELLPTDLARTPQAAIRDLSGTFRYSNPDFRVNETSSNGQGGSTTSYEMVMEIYVNFDGGGSLDFEDVESAEGVDGFGVGYMELAGSGDRCVGLFTGGIFGPEWRVTGKDGEDSMLAARYFPNQGSEGTEASGYVRDAYFYGDSAAFLNGDFGFSTESNSISGEFLLEKGSFDEATNDPAWGDESWYTED